MCVRTLLTAAKRKTPVKKPAKAPAKSARKAPAKRKPKAVTAGQDWCVRD
jgi:hypothetical protein